MEYIGFRRFPFGARKAGRLSMTSQKKYINGCFWTLVPQVVMTVLCVATKLESSWCQISRHSDYMLCCRNVDSARILDLPWWRHQMETFSALLALCAGNSPLTGEFPSQRQVTRSFDVFFDLRLKKRLSKQSLGWWSQTPSHPLWRHSNAVYFVFTLHRWPFNFVMEQIHKTTLFESRIPSTI